jgi:hypothetical protein
MVTLTIGPAVLDLAGIRAGDRNLIDLTLTANGVPVNLTGTVVESQARLTPTDPVALSAVVTMVNAAAGHLTIRWPGEDVRDDARIVQPGVNLTALGYSSSIFDNGAVDAGSPVGTLATQTQWGLATLFRLAA